MSFIIHNKPIMEILLLVSHYRWESLQLERAVKDFVLGTPSKTWSQYSNSSVPDTSNHDINHYATLQFILKI